MRLHPFFYIDIDSFLESFRHFVLALLSREVSPVKVCAVGCLRDPPRILPFLDPVHVLSWPPPCSLLLSILLLSQHDSHLFNLRLVGLSVSLLSKMNQFFFPPIACLLIPELSHSCKVLTPMECASTHALLSLKFSSFSFLFTAPSFLQHLSPCYSPGREPSYHATDQPSFAFAPV